MDISFTKRSGKYDQMRVVRGDVVDVIDCPKQRIIPHEMVHYAVETVLQQRGFLSRVRDGEPAASRMAAEAQSDGVERLVEVFQGDAWSGGDSSSQEMLELYRVTCAARECPTLPVGAQDIVRVRDRIRELDVQWQALAIGETMILHFDDDKAAV